MEGKDGLSDSQYTSQDKMEETQREQNQVRVSGATLCLHDYKTD